MKYYQHISKLPIWNFREILKTGDLRYLLILDDYFEGLPKKFPEDELRKTYKELIYQFDVLDLYLQRLKMQAIKTFLEFWEVTLDEAKDEKKLMKISMLWTKLVYMDDATKADVFDDLTETSNQRNWLTPLAIAIEKYNEQRDKRNKKVINDLEDTAAILEEELKINIDIFTCSVARFNAYEKRLETKTKQRKATKKKR